MKKNIVTLLAAGFVIASCSMNEINEGLVRKEMKTLYATTEIDTKTSLGENEDGVYKVSWSEGDRIVLIDERGFTATYATEESGKSRAQFNLKKGPEDMDFENGIIAGYPAENIYLNSPDPKIPVFITIPNIQEYKDITFADNVMPMISDATTGNELKFNNAAGVIRLMVSASEDITVKSITINSPSEYISGVCGYIPETKSYYFDEILKSEKSVKLSCGDGVAIGKEAKPFFIVVPHQEYKGMEIVVKTNDGFEQSFVMKSDRTITIKRSSVATIPLHVDELVESDDDSADIQFESYSVGWSYRYFDRGNGYSRYFNSEDPGQLMIWKAYNNGTDPYFNYPEINIASSRVRIDLLEDTVPDADIHTIDFRIDRNNDCIDIMAYDPEGNEIRYGSDGTTPFLNENHFISLDVLTSNVAKLAEVNLPFMDFPVTYKARKFVVNKDNKMKYSIAFDITLGATPENKEIDLGTYSIPYTQAQINKIPVTPITKAVAADAEAFADLPVHNTQNFAVTVGPWNDTWTRESWNQKDIGYLELRSTAGYNTIAYVMNPQTYAIEEDAYLEIPQNAEYDTTYELKETWSFYGIKYTFKAKVTCQRPVYKLVANPKFVSNGVVNLNGKVTYPLYANKTYTGGEEYALNKINLRDYVTVEGMSKLDKLYNELQVSYRIKETRPYYNEYTAPLGVSFIEYADPAVISTSQWPYHAYYDAQNNYVEEMTDVILYWKSVDQYPGNSNVYETINEIDVEYQLLSHDGLVKFGDPLTLKLVVPELLRFETTKTLTEPWMNNDVPTVTNIYKALNITDTKSNAQISNPKATSAADFFDYVYTENKQTVTMDGVRNVYGISIVPDAANARVYLKSGIALTANDYIFDPETGDVQLGNNSGNITDNIIIEIPVTMYHKYQGSHVHKVTVKVEFTK
ncbi:MAG: hypothetical protein IJ971_01960 [Bacteroidales bacterium]|nr:hypothetical protein [Bacteroidales bacterium]